MLHIKSIVFESEKPSCFSSCCWVRNDVLIFASWEDCCLYELRINTDLLDSKSIPTPIKISSPLPSPILTISTLPSTTTLTPDNPFALNHKGGSIPSIIAAGCADGSLYVFQVQLNLDDQPDRTTPTTVVRKQRSVNAGAAITAVLFTANGSSILVGTESGDLALYSPQGQLRHQLRAGITAPIHSINPAGPDTVLVAAGPSVHMVPLSAAHESSKHMIAARGMAVTSACTRGQLTVSAVEGQGVVFSAGGQKQATLVLPGDIDSVSSVAVSSAAHHTIVAGTRAGMLLVARTDGSMADLRSGAIGAISCLRFSPGGSFFVALGRRGIAVGALVGLRAAYGFTEASVEDPNSVRFHDQVTAGSDLYGAAGGAEVITSLVVGYSHIYALTQDSVLAFSTPNERASGSADSSTAWMVSPRRQRNGREDSVHSAVSLFASSQSVQDHIEHAPCCLAPLPDGGCAVVDVSGRCSILSAELRRVFSFDSGIPDLRCLTGGLGVVGSVDPGHPTTLRLVDPRTGGAVGGVTNIEHSARISAISIDSLPASSRRVVAVLDSTRSVYIGEIPLAGGTGGPPKLRQLECSPAIDIKFVEGTDALVILTVSGIKLHPIPRTAHSPVDVSPLSAAPTAVEIPTGAIIETALPARRSSDHPAAILRPALCLLRYPSGSLVPHALPELPLLTKWLGENGRFKDAIRLCRSIGSPALWSLCARMALEKGDLPAAQAAFSELGMVAPAVFSLEAEASHGPLRESALWFVRGDPQHGIDSLVSGGYIGRAVAACCELWDFDRARQLCSGSAGGEFLPLLIQMRRELLSEVGLPCDETKEPWFSLVKNIPVGHLTPEYAEKLKGK
eukprot:gnl/Dysnectes_brevis/700_a772_947.p1 GENE.gnl/Dysnectes_brevis/700_a772_947~~gnl/Dysnectes_brevis/700_a772_947.p1  ORF type:complete len:856 (-),score=314.74 gnl/Dysnectes_brevis/700_a772_947:964-3507(-)